MRQSLVSMLTPTNRDPEEDPRRRQSSVSSRKGSCQPPQSEHPEARPSTMRTLSTDDPKLDSFRYEFRRFAAVTTAHGIPMALNATRWYVRMLWIALSVFSVGIFTYQCVLVYEKFMRKDKIVNVKLQFGNVPFPAVTICNLNPFKKHLAMVVPEVSETLDAYHQAVTYSKHADQHYNETPQARARRNTYGGFRYVQYEPVMSDCECTESSESDSVPEDCVQLNSVPKNDQSYCICNYDRQDSAIWPCYKRQAWVESLCPECNDIGFCNLPMTNGTNILPCLCQKNVSYCLLRPERMRRMWEVRGDRIPDEGSPFREDFLAHLKNLGYENMTDEVAITTKTKEKLILTMASLPEPRRIALSYGKMELIRMCSFNEHQCDIINDFKIHVDPAFGNCYTFNANKERPPLVSSRAGPSHGLRLLVHINASDYLPTTEASGVRIAIHSQEEYPFPDAFGYSAPTYHLSSFGLALRKVNRLPMPIGSCLLPNESLPLDYIYQRHKYDPEGCYKSCYQNRIIKKCGCGDPRYPVARNSTRFCDSSDLQARNCLILEGIKFSRSGDCSCKHPCVHDDYSTTFSSAHLITPNVFKGIAGDISGEETVAMVEIYYEQMSHEILWESESYMFVNFISDLGGQAGLWLGASILTLFEVLVFALRVSTIFCRRCVCRGKTVATEAGCEETPVANGGGKKEFSTANGKEAEKEEFIIPGEKVSHQDLESVLSPGRMTIQSDDWNNNRTENHKRLASLDLSSFSLEPSYDYNKRSPFANGIENHQQRKENGRKSGHQNENGTKNGTIRRKESLTEDSSGNDVPVKPKRAFDANPVVNNKGAIVVPSLGSLSSANEEETEDSELGYGTEDGFGGERSSTQIVTGQGFLTR